MGSLGSSPRMRGTLSKTCTPRPELGIIPAYAGNTGVRQTGRPTDGDHPRVCGEHPASYDAGIGGVGSSPRMRGTLQNAIEIRVGAGIIPAYAGNTTSYHLFRRDRRDHPRVCGEHCHCNRIQPRTEGSSPRMRGTLGHVHQWLPQLGIIPAYAGNTDERVRSGIIPAYAGNTWQTLRVESSARDHPRVCGEHMYEADVMKPSPGSSPRMRGTLVLNISLFLSTGIIPAYAGNTSRSASSQRR